jgi:hypothetical protein
MEAAGLMSKPDPARTENGCTAESLRAGGRAAGNSRGSDRRGSAGMRSRRPIGCSWAWASPGSTRGAGRAEVSPSEVGPSEVGPSEVGPSKVSRAEVSRSEVNPCGRAVAAPDEGRTQPCGLAHHSVRPDPAPLGRARRYQRKWTKMRPKFLASFSTR